MYKAHASRLLLALAVYAALRIWLLPVFVPHHSPSVGVVWEVLAGALIFGFWAWRDVRRIQGHSWPIDRFIPTLERKRGGKH